MKGKKTFYEREGSTGTKYRSGQKLKSGSERGRRRFCPKKKEY